MKRELRVRELQLLDATRRRFLRHQQDLRASQIGRLEQEIRRKVATLLHVCFNLVDRQNLLEGDFTIHTWMMCHTRHPFKNLTFTTEGSPGARNHCNSPRP